MAEALIYEIDGVTVDQYNAVNSELGIDPGSGGTVFASSPVERCSSARRPSTTTGSWVATRPRWRARCATPSACRRGSAFSMWAAGRAA